MHAPFALPAPLSELGDEYELLSELGRGGSAVVYHARDRALRRDVAIKVVHPRATSPSDDPVARLAREARTVAQLQHPHIVTVYGVRRLHGGGLALIMQYVPGSTLKAVVQREGPLPPDRCERVLRDVARALAFAHARGIVHRDVKPENIFLDAESGRALLADFGIARTDEHESMTLTGTAIGTPFYMSPEQVEGAPLDGRSDLYSLGLVAWEMLTGRRPWDGESLYNVIYKQKHEELPPIEALRSGAPRRLQYIVERMLQKRPAARWAGADGLLAQLEHSVLPADFARWQTTLPGRIARFRAASSARPATLPPTHAAADQPAELPHTVGGAPTLQFVRDRPQALRGAGDGTPDVESSTAPPLAPPGGLADTLTFAPGDAIAPAAASSRPPAALHGDERAGPEEVTHLDRDAPAPAQSDVVAYGDAVEPTWGVPEDVPARATPRRPRWLAAGAVAASVLLLTAAAWRTWSVAERAPDDQARSIAAPGDPARDPGADPQPGTPIAVGAALARGTAQSAGRSAPPAPSGRSNDMVAVGGRHSCAVTYGWRVYCWGENDRGQLGDGTVTDHPVATPTATSLALVQVSAGEAHTCAVTRLGDVYCWGDDAYGQLGDATTVRRTAPVRIAGPGVYRAVRAGGRHSCAITVDGTVACWGGNDQGQLGDGTTTARDVPTPVLFAEGPRIQTVAVGQLHSCALDADGAAWCWGGNASGQLGDGTTTARRVPTRVAGETRFVTLAAGSRHSCGVTVKGAVHCWGRPENGRLGAAARGPAVPRPVPVPLSPRARAVQITAGASHSCAVGGEGESWCWGWNAYGQLGDSTRTTGRGPTRVRTTERFSAVSAGNRHSCGVTADGRAFCWGSNARGQLGDGTRDPRIGPTPVEFGTAQVAMPLAQR